LIMARVIASTCQAPIAPSTPPSRAPSPATTPASAGSGQAAYVIAVLTGLLALDNDGLVIGRLAELPPQSFASGAMLHPAGRQIAFVLTNISQGAQNGFGSDIYLVNVDGSGLQKIVTHEK